ncbi:hypothetical protein [Amycolatopsis sp. NPDC004079]|uniref:hypothetical protein n=1 Tax=Amycolatopsis sp. NPDC004079 TaxID=3154549 RepID=UPI0033B4E6E3
MTTPADGGQNTADNIRHDIVNGQAAGSPRVGQPRGTAGGQDLENLRRAMLDNGASTQEIAETLGRRRGLGLLSAWRHALGLTRDEVATRYNAEVCPWPVNTPHRRPDKAPLMATGFPVDGQISPR